jgi:thioredoxin 1
MKLRTMTEEEFEREVLAAPGPVLLDFAAAWCPPCRALAPTLEALARERAGRLRVETIDADRSPRLAQRCDVRSLPTLISFAGGRELGRTVGALAREKLLERLKL